MSRLVARPRDPRPALALAAAVLAVLIGLYWLALARERAWPTPIVPVAEALAPQSVSLAVTDPALAAAIALRPLFISERRPIIEAKEEDAIEVKRDVFTDARLVGVIGGASEGVAIIRHDGELTRVKKGGQFGGWTLERLESRLARFTHAGFDPRELRLEYDVVTPIPIIPASAPPARRPRR
ncbi:hypothetical protein AGMMS49543_10420 [Betaproteobacteria bacterium]|nr:hypothetical protein AGMMS49543_10420 [Betaproteobacteria bacterium]GHU20113.1 hypothetical protein AGMMS50243_13790 [Betaproteobacteria bacterium]